MKYVVQVMTLGDMSSTGLADADGEPEDIVVQTMGIYDSLEQASENSLKDYNAFVDEHGDMEESGCWMECRLLDLVSLEDAYYRGE